MFDQANAALEAGRPPFPVLALQRTMDCQVGLRRPAGRSYRIPFAPSSTCSMPRPSKSSTLLNGNTGRRALYALPMGRGSNHVHVWKSLLERAGFTLADIPREWAAFWSFWCDQVQPAVRRATGRDDIWGVGLPMSPTSDATDQVLQFQLAYDAPWFTPDGSLQVDDPSVRAGMVKALTDYTAIWRKGCTPPTQRGGRAPATTRRSWRNRW